MTPKEVLKKYWGYDDFRPLQEEIIMSVLEGHDTLGLMPTGGGKSITFQVPALIKGGLTLVVTPLISLMKDQCDNLSRHGIKAAAVYMGMTQTEVSDTYSRVTCGGYSFLYLSPERLETQTFKQHLQYMDVRMIVVDEAHCISQWGYDFRPPYLRIATLRRLIAQNLQTTPLQSPVPCMALTATATTEVVKDIQDKLEFRPGARVLQSSFERTNLMYDVIESEDKAGLLIDLFSHQEKGSGIVYVRSRKQTADYADILNKAGITADFYHAGLRPADKEERQEKWQRNEIQVIVATNAFGMGIDKPDVRMVVHVDLPGSPEEYFQEAGRAGRDGLPARAVIVVCERDKMHLLNCIHMEFPEREFVRMVYSRLGSFFQLAVGFGYMHQYEFDIYKFCTAYRLSMYQVHSALKMLDKAGYIAYLQEPERHSRVMILVSKEKLYHLPQFDEDCHRIINALLRLYTGLFADYVFIREDELMRYTHLDRDILYQKLLLLTRFKILHYIPARQMPAIQYKTTRLDTEEIVLHRDIYEKRQQRMKERADAMIDYVSSHDTCRQRRLIGYFGQDMGHDCGHCDVCRSRDVANAGKRFLGDNSDEDIEQLRCAMDESDITLRDAVDALHSRPQ